MRYIFASLWLSQCCRFFSDYALRLFVVQETATQFARGGEAAWHTVVALFMAPAALLPPFYGVLGNSFPKNRVLFLAALFCFVVLVPFLLIGHGGWWFVVISLVALGSSLYSPIRHAILPAAAVDLQWRLPFAMGFIEMGAILSMVLGMTVGSYLQGQSWNSLALGFTLPTTPAFALVLVTSLLSVLFSLNTRFPSDICRPQRMLVAIRSFFSDLRRLFQRPSTYQPLVGIALLRGLVTIAAGAFVADALTKSTGTTPALEILLAIAFASTLGMACGSIMAGFISPKEDPLRQIPYFAMFLTLILVVSAILDEKPAWILFLAGLMGGLINVPLLSVFQENTPADTRGNAMAILNSLGCLAMALLSGVFAALAWFALLPSAMQFWLVAFLGGMVTLLAWWTLGTKLGEARENPR